MTFKDLQKLAQSQHLEPGPELQRLRDKPFWHWERTRHAEKHKASKGRCCFNHIIGLPKKDGKRLPMFDYEMLLYKSLIEHGYLNSNPSGALAHPFKLKHLWVKKATGLGVTEFMLGSWLGFALSMTTIAVLKWL